MVKLTVRVVALSLGVLGSSVWGQTLEVLHSFGGTDGIKPDATLTIGPDGNLYGTTTEGGLNDAGTIFRVKLDGQVDILDHFETDTTGRESKARLVNVGDGYLYGVTKRNGNVAGDPAGTVFRFDPVNEELTPVFAIKSPSGPFPRNPESLVATSPTTLHVLGYDPGGLWKVSTVGDPAALVRNFDKSDTATEGLFHASIIRGSDGFLYGTSEGGGDTAHGTIFRVAPDGSEFTRLLSCNYSVTGKRPVSAMVEGPDGNFYGTMVDGPGNNGSIYRITPTGEFTLLHKLEDLRYPEGDLMITDGYLYGTAWDLGPGGNGVGGIFRIRLDGKKSTYRVLYSFKGSSGPIPYPNGRGPRAGVVQAEDGYLYGVTLEGGEYGGGTVFRLKVKDLPPPPVNHPPVAVADYAVSTGDAVTVDVLANDFDVDGDNLLVSIVEEPDFGTAEVQNDGSILYTPDTYVDHDSFRYKISDGRGESSIAEVVISNTPATPLIVAGSYTGLMSIPSLTTPSGRVALTVADSGKFTGTLFTQKKRLPIKGQFKGNGTAITTVKLPKEGRRTLFLSVTAGQPEVINSYVLADRFWEGSAGRTVTANIEKKASYTVLISTQSEETLTESFMPAGYGYGVVTIKPNGSVKISGKFGDGSNLSTSTSLVEIDGDTQIPIFAEPVKGGVFRSLLFGTEDEGFTGLARWIRPAAKKQKGPYGVGFAGLAAVEITPFIRPEGNDPVINISGGYVEASEGPIKNAGSGGFTIDGKRITVGEPLKKLKIDRKTGLFSGTIVVDGKPRSFKGAINQGGKFGLGSLSVKGETGKVELYQLID